MRGLGFTVLILSLLSVYGCLRGKEDQKEPRGEIFIGGDADEIEVTVGEALKLRAKGNIFIPEITYLWTIDPHPPHIHFDAVSEVLAIENLAVGLYRVMLRAGSKDQSFIDSKEVRVKEALVQISASAVIEPGDAHLFSADITEDADLVFSWNIEPSRGVHIISETIRSLHVKVDEEGEYQISLWVKSDSGRSGVAYSTLFVSREPVPVFTAPDIVEPGQVVSFDASQSENPSRENMTYVWEISESDARIGMFRTDDPVFEYRFLRAGEYTVSLYIDAIKSEESLQSRKIRRKRRIRVNERPQARINHSELVYLTIDTEMEVNGGASEDGDNDALSYRWTAEPADAVRISRPTSKSSTVSLLHAREVRLFLRVSDGVWNTDSVAELRILPNHPPVAHGFGNLIVRTGGSVRLDGRKSFDIDGNALSYSWSVVESEGAKIDNADRMVATFSADTEGVYHVVFSVSDGILKSRDEHFTVVVGSYWFVDGNADSWGSGQNWGEAFQSIPQALEVAEPGDEIWISEGLYYPQVSTASFLIPPGVAIYGGFSRSEVYKHQRNITAHATVLSGDIDGNDLVSDNGLSIIIEGQNATHVVEFLEDKGLSAVLNGCYITGGRAYADEPHGLMGGGILAVNASPVLKNIVFEMNVAKKLGGALYVENGSPLLSNVTFIHNSAELGGGYFDLNGNVNLSHATFIRNIGVRGGGIYFEKSRASVMNTHIEGNIAHVGSGLAVVHSHLMLLGVTILQNKLGYAHGQRGAGIVVVEDSEVDVINSILWNHEKETQRSLIENIFVDDSKTSFTHSLVGGSRGSGENWNAEAGEDGGKNIDMDPLFRSQGVMFLNPSRLMDHSPVKDEGLESYVLKDITDVDEDSDFSEIVPYDLYYNKRIVGKTVDIGAEELLY